MKPILYNNKKAHTDRTQTLITLCYFGLYLAVGLSLLIKQPFGNPPDEYNRYLIPQYIAQNGTLPNGYEESIRIGGYGFSYGFQPILPYMLQGYAMRFVTLFTDSPTALLYTARSVNLLLGLCTAWVVLLLAKKWFRDMRMGWCFAFLAVFLPQSIFVHTYVNTDSCCMLSIAVMLYGLTLGLESRFSLRSCAILAGGIILCALSYYNAYGYILSSILLFSACFLTSAPDGSGRKTHAEVPESRHRDTPKAGRRRNPLRSLSFDIRNFLAKGFFISALVLAGIGWWFVRSAILYDGDFLGLRARNECASLYAIPEFHPDTRVTWQNQGYSLWDMMRESDFRTLSVMSFIGVYGPMVITTSIWVYRFYKALFLGGILLCAAIPLSRTTGVKGLYEDRRGLRIFYHANMLFCMAMPLFLSLTYSYSTDYQPQGRYLLPALLPLCYYTLHGLDKAFHLHQTSHNSRLLTVSALLLCTAVTGMLALTVYGYAFPYYEANPIAP